MREPCGEENSELNVRGYWLKLARGHNETLRERARAELAKEPSVPRSAAYIWRWWCELDAGRSYGFNGPAPLSYQDIESWARLSGHSPTPDDVSALVLIDRIVSNPGKREDNGAERR